MSAWTAPFIPCLGVADAAVSSLSSAPRVLPTEPPDGGWGPGGHAITNGELIAAARAQIAELHAKKPDG